MDIKTWVYSKSLAKCGTKNQHILNISLVGCILKGGQISFTFNIWDTVFFKGGPGQNSMNSLSAYPDLLKFLADQSHLHLGGPLILLAPQLIASNLKGTIQPIYA